MEIKIYNVLLAYEANQYIVKWIDNDGECHGYHSKSLWVVLSKTYFKLTNQGNHEKQRNM